MFKESLGEYLKRERELRQISLEEVAEGTKIAIYRLRAMEADCWENLPAEIFVRLYQELC
jgi:cytoskeleton protein RodZ